ncbi:acetone carboxylase [Nocardioides bruguierae]|uniref:acetone carboxylase n=1 Tax=Nocardioides bruguierae TaxID=2945102 RepID=UPI0020201C98|nr:acetone carboxylase [Nocardioides bruguierae]MCL8024462.1 acetone carboxylase [Nocardioides bruguierae]
MTLPEPPATEPDVCSSKGCTAAAEHALLWNNPKVHTPERRKVWLACEEHRPTLTSFLGSRGFLKDVVPFEPGADLAI